MVELKEHEYKESSFLSDTYDFIGSLYEVVASKPPGGCAYYCMSYLSCYFLDIKSLF